MDFQSVFFRTDWKSILPRITEIISGRFVLILAGRQGCVARSEARRACEVLESFTKLSTPIAIGYRPERGARWPSIFQSAHRLTDEDRPDLVHSECGGGIWADAATEWIQGSDVWESIKNRQTRVWLYQNANGTSFRWT